MANEEHIIKGCQYQIGYNNAADAHQIQSGISVLHYTDVNRLLAKVLNEYARNDSIYQFDTIELELGTISRSNYQNELLYRLEEELSNFLKAAIKPDGELKTGHRILLDDHLLLHLQHFFLYGYWPWNAPMGSDPDTALVSVLSNRKDDFVTILKQIGKKDVVRKRIIYYYPDLALETIVDAIAGNDRAYMNQYRKDIFKYQQKNQVVDGSESNFRYVVWDIILAYLLLNKESYFSKKSFLSDLIMQLARRYRIDYHFLLLTLEKGISEDHSLVIDREFKKIILELSQVEFKIQAGLERGSNKRTERSSYSFDLFFKQLSHYLEHGSLGVNSQLQNRGTLEFYLFYYLDELTTGKARQKLLGWLSGHQQSKILELGNEVFWNKVIERLNVPVLLEGKKFLNELVEFRTDRTLASVHLPDELKRKIPYLLLETFPHYQADKEAFLYLLLEKIEKETQQDQIQFSAYLQDYSRSSAVIFGTVVHDFLRHRLTIYSRLSGQMDEKKRTAVPSPFREIVEQITVQSQKLSAKKLDEWLSINLLQWAEETDLTLAVFIEKLKFYFQQLQKSKVQSQVLNYLSDIEDKVAANERPDSQSDELFTTLIREAQAIYQATAGHFKKEYSSDMAFQKFILRLGKMSGQELKQFLKYAKSTGAIEELVQWLRSLVDDSLKRTGKIETEKISGTSADIAGLLNEIISYLHKGQLPKQSSIRNWSLDGTNMLKALELLNPNERLVLEQTLKGILPQIRSVFFTKDDLFCKIIQEINVLVILREIEQQASLVNASEWMLWLTERLEGWMRRTKMGRTNLLNVLTLKIIEKKDSAPIAQAILQLLPTAIRQRKEQLQVEQRTGPLQHVTDIQQLLSSELGYLLRQSKMLKQRLPEVLDLLAALGRKYRIETVVLVKEFRFLTDDEQLQFLLNEKYANVIAADKHTAERKDTTKDDVFVWELLTWFARRGVLPWWGDTYTLTDLRRMFKTQWNKSPQKAAYFIKRSADHRYTLRLIDDQLFPVLLEHVNTRVSPASSLLFSKLFRWIEEELQVLQASRSFSTEIRSSILKIMLSAETKNRLDEGIVEIFNLLAKRLHIALKELHQLFYNKLQRDGAALANEFKRWRDEQKMKETKAGRIEGSWIKNEEESGSLFLKDDKLDVQLFLSLIRKSPAKVRQLFKQAENRKRVISELNREDLFDALKALSPQSEHTRYNDILSIMEQLGQLLSIQKLQNFWSGFFDALMQKIALHGHLSWQVDDWATLFYLSLKKALDYNEESMIIRKMRSINTSNEYMIPGFRNELIRSVLSRDDEVSQPLPRADKTDVAAEKKQVSEKKIPMKDEEFDNEEQLGDPIFIKNAGLILLWPFLKILFEKTGLFSENKFISDEKRFLAVLLLVYAATGDYQKKLPEVYLPKILCGMSPDQPIDFSLKIPEEHLQVVDDLLKAVIQQWSILKNTSIEGLRESFLKREGKLSIDEEEYVLQVEHKSFDMLLDHIPWTISTVKLSWMPKLLNVEWR